MTEGLTLLSPTTGRPLRAEGPGYLADGTERWPVVAGIPFLRTGREGLRDAALAALDRGDERAALALLLRDQDDWARLPPPSLDAAGGLADAVGHMTLRETMATLNFGPVAHYFAHRWSAPTFLSALGLLETRWTDPPLVLEIACGIGQILRDLNRRGTAVAGIDVVFAKLWLAKTFLLPDAPLVCADVTSGIPVALPEGTAILCHDAFYFMPEQERIAGHLMRAAGASGTVLIGHAHNVRFEHGIAGRPRTPEEYGALFPGCLLYDDAELARSPAPARTAAELATVEAVSLAWSAGTVDPRPVDLRSPHPGARLRLNPLLERDGNRLRPAWPTPAFAREYAAATYLEAEVPPEDLPEGTSRIDDPRIRDLARRRILLDLPERW
ncbi:class I SAM-dependent methyltransferase [Skermanella pratensis]|uniref:class I SAM-dependent methyltransferase n=1 Tax=Skermanella pratensis TaxID=2233999 RepID=UPI001787A94D|nr:methyltransferase domain-containing protein [Skermanella pratensis]